MHFPFRLSTGALLTGLLLTSFAVIRPAHAADVSINPPAVPVAVAQANLTVTVAFDKTSVTPPGIVELTFIVTNTGDVTARQVSLVNTLPVEFSADTTAMASQLKSLGDLASGDTVTKSYSIKIPAGTPTDRYVDEVVTSAANADSIQSTAALDVTNGQVLGATDTNPNVLAASGTPVSSLILWVFGLLLLGFGCGKTVRLIR